MMLNTPCTVIPAAARVPRDDLPLCAAYSKAGAMKVIRSVQSLLFVLSIMVNAVLLPVGLVLLDASYAVRAQSASTGPEIVFASSR